MENEENKEQELLEKRLAYPRVSEIIGKQTEREMRAIPPETLNYAALRGTRIHSYCTTYLKGLWMPEIEEEYAPYVNAFIGWADENIQETLFTNERLYDDELRFTGEYDCIVTLKNSSKTVMLDIKTSANVSKAWGVQLAAYQRLLRMNEYEVDSVANLHLKKMRAPFFDDVTLQQVPAIVKAKLIEYQEIEIIKNWNIFGCALACYDFFERKESK